jgi:hypothetical protein
LGVGEVVVSGLLVIVVTLVSRVIYTLWRLHMKIKTSDVLKAIKALSKTASGIGEDAVDTGLQDIANAIATVGGCQQSNLRTLVTKIINYVTEDEIELPAVAAPKRKLKVVKVVANGNSHNYRIGKLVMFQNDVLNVCLRRDGTEGNNLNIADTVAVTKAEFNHFWDGLMEQTDKKAVRALVAREIGSIVTVDDED